MSSLKNNPLPMKDRVENALASNHPTSVAQLARIVLSENTLDEIEFVAAVRAMVKDGSLVLQKPSYELESIFDYLLTMTLAGWLWVSLGLTALAVAVVTLIPANSFFNIFRWILGSVLVAYLPGFGLLQLLFTNDAGSDAFERFALTIGLSLVVVSLVGLVLNFTPLGIRFIPVTVSLVVFSVASIVAAAARRYYAMRK